MANTNVPAPPAVVVDCTQPVDTEEYLKHCVDLVHGDNRILLMATDILALLSFFSYGIMWYLQRKGIVEVSPSFLRISRWILFACMIAPGAVRLGLSQHAILYIALLIVGVCGFLKIRSKLGL